LAAEVLFGWTASLAGAQTADRTRSNRAQAIVSSGGLVSYEGGSGGGVVREIDDPHTGDRWILVRNDQMPGGPGRMVLLTPDRATTVSGAAQPILTLTEETKSPLIIHAGDRVIVERHTAVVDAVLEARAVNPAALGAEFNLRLTVGGKVLRAVALGPGRAAFLPESGGRP
jgi:hypothetical protein